MFAASTYAQERYLFPFFLFPSPVFFSLEVRMLSTSGGQRHSVTRLVKSTDVAHFQHDGETQNGADAGDGERPSNSYRSRTRPTIVFSIFPIRPVR